MTNENKIKSMSLEKLAEFIDDIYREGKRFVNPPYCENSCTKPINYPCRLCVEEWLRKDSKR